MTKRTVTTEVKELSLSEKSIPKSQKLQVGLANGVTVFIDVLGMDPARWPKIKSKMSVTFNWTD